MESVEQLQSSDTVFEIDNHLFADHHGVYQRCPAPKGSAAQVCPGNGSAAPAQVDGASGDDC